MRSTISAGLAPLSARSPPWKNQVGRGLPQIRQDGLKRGPVAVDVGYNRKAHQVHFRSKKELGVLSLS